MKKFIKMFGAAGLLAAMMMFSGCGSDDSGCGSNPATKSAAPVTVPSTVASGVATTSAAVSLKTDSGTTVVSIPAGTTITTNATGGFTAAPVVTVTTPTNGTTSGVTPAKSGTTSLVVSDAAGSVDISFNTSGKVTLGTPVSVVIPVVKAPSTTPATVIAIKTDGSTKTYNTGVYDATAKTVTVSGVTDFCWFVVDPVFKKDDGTTGSASTFHL